MTSSALAEHPEDTSSLYGESPLVEEVEVQRPYAVSDFATQPEGLTPPVSLTIVVPAAASVDGDGEPLGCSRDRNEACQLHVVAFSRDIMGSSIH